MLLLFHLIEHYFNKLVMRFSTNIFYGIVADTWVLDCRFYNVNKFDHNKKGCSVLTLKDTYNNYAVVDFILDFEMAL